MKNYIYSDEEDFSEEKEEEEEFEVPVQKTKTKKKKKIGLKNKKYVFNEDIFDIKVAKSIRKAHTKKDKFSDWVNENLTHLKNLYNLSCLSCKEADFYFYIYENTHKENN